MLLCAGKGLTLVYSVLEGKFAERYADAQAAKQVRQVVTQVWCVYQSLSDRCIYQTGVACVSLCEAGGQTGVCQSLTQICVSLSCSQVDRCVLVLCQADGWTGVCQFIRQAFVSHSFNNKSRQVCVSL